MYANIEQMVGFKITPMFYYCWKYLTPALTGFTFTFCVVTFTPIK